MKPIGTWNGIKHFSKLKDYNANNFVDHIKINPILAIKYSLIGDNGYCFKINPHPTGNISDAGICEVKKKNININIPDKLANTDTYILFGSTEEIEFSEDQLNKVIANDIDNILEHIWINSLSPETYLIYLNMTMT